MKLDWNCIRAVLTATEELTQGDMLAPGTLPGYSDDMVIEHIRLLQEAGLIEGYPAGRSARFAVRLTWNGHQFLATMKSPTLWDKVKTDAKDSGIALSFDVVKLLAGKWLGILLGS
jgi:hypothetical protein